MHLKFDLVNRQGVNSSSLPEVSGHRFPRKRDLCTPKFTDVTVSRMNQDLRARIFLQNTLNQILRFAFFPLVLTTNWIDRVITSSLMLVSDERKAEPLCLANHRPKDRLDRIKTDAEGGNAESIRPLHTAGIERLSRKIAKSTIIERLEKLQGQPSCLRDMVSLVNHDDLSGLRKPNDFIDSRKYANVIEIGIVGRRRPSHSPIKLAYRFFFTAKKRQGGRFSLVISKPPLPVVAGRLQLFNAIERLNVRVRSRANKSKTVPNVFLRASTRGKGTADECGNDKQSTDRKGL